MEMNLSQVLDQVSKDKGIEREVLVDAIEAAILTAAKKVFGINREIEAQFNEETGQVELFQYMTVVEQVEEPATQIVIDKARLVDPEAQPDDELGFQIFYREEDQGRAKEEDEKYGDLLGIQTHRRSFGRIAAQTAKQVILQRVREAERNMVYNDFKDRKNELVTGIARRFERGNVIIDLGRAEAILPAREQTHRESYRAGDRVQAFVLDVQKHAKGPQIILSRANEGLIRKLFEMEVPEIYESIVEIVSVAREPGERTKIAVRSRDTDVDPVGACVGMKGARVQAVVQELRGEKIDIVPHHEDPARFVCAAIAPAEVARVLVDDDNNIIELIVPDDQLSLAIGRRGQNVRLAHKLVGYEIKIYSETRIEEIKEELRQCLLAAQIDAGLIEYMFKLGFHSADNLLNAEAGELATIPGVDMDMALRIQGVAHKLREDRQAREEKQKGPGSPIVVDVAATAGGAAPEPPDFAAVDNGAMPGVEVQAMAGSPADADLGDSEDAVSTTDP